MSPAKLRSFRILHGALAASIIIYGVVLKLELSQSTIKPALEILRLLQPALWIVYVVSLMVLFGVIRPRLRNQRGPSSAAMAYQNMMIMSDAFIESGPIYGLLLGFMGGPYLYFVEFAVVALILMAVTWPTDQSVTDFCS